MQQATREGCNHTSVGVVVLDVSQERLLLIERKKFPFGFACPAGHVEDGETFEHAAKRELLEEVGLVAVHLQLVLNTTVENACRRPGGNWHRWNVYQADVTGEVVQNLAETKHIEWSTADALRGMARKTEHYRAGRITDHAWEQSPGLEPVWYDFFKRLYLLP